MFALEVDFKSFVALSTDENNLLRPQMESIALNTLNTGLVIRSREGLLEQLWRMPV